MSEKLAHHPHEQAQFSFRNQLEQAESAPNDTLNQGTVEANPVAQGIFYDSPSRIIHDAELLQGGAEIKGNQLYPTAEQVAALKEQYEGSTLQKLAVLALHDAELDNLNKDVTTLERSVENKESLRQVLEDRVSPYAGIFNEHIPPFSPNRWYRPDTDETEPVSWSQHTVKESTRGRAKIENEFKLYYERGEEANSLQQVNVGIKGPTSEMFARLDKNAREIAGTAPYRLHPDWQHSSVLALKYGDTKRLEQLSLQLEPFRHVREAYEGTALESLVAAADQPKPESRRIGVDINMQDETSPVLKITDIPANTIVRPYDLAVYGQQELVYEFVNTATNEVEYHFDADKNIFLKVTVKNNGIPNCPEELSPEEFAQVVSDMLRIIPTSEV